MHKKFFYAVMLFASLSLFTTTNVFAIGHKQPTNSHYHQHQQHNPHQKLIVGDSETVTIDEITNLSYLEIGEDATLTAPDGYILTLTVNGVQENIETGNYRGDIVLTVLEDNIITFTMGSTTLTHYFQQGLYIDSTGIVPEKSALSAIRSGKIKDQSAKNIAMSSKGDYFNGVFVTDGGTYTLDHATIDFTGDGGNDFAGYGAALMSTGEGSTLYINDSKVTTYGVTRTALLQTDGGHMVIKNSTIKGYDGTLPDYYLPNGMPGTMFNVPWPLGLKGNNRTTNLVGVNSQESFINSYIASENWGVLSTDMGSGVTLTTINSKIENLGDSGYGLYAIGNGSTVQVYGSEIDVKDYATILIGGTVIYGDSDKETVSTLNDELELNLSSREMAHMPVKETIVNSGRFGFMSHESTTSKVIITDATEINCGESIFVVRGVPTVVEVDGQYGAQLNAGVEALQADETSGEKVILQVMDLDKAQKNTYTWEEDVPYPFSNYVDSTLNVFTRDYIEPCEDYDNVDVDDTRDLTTATEGTDVLATFSNITLDGDFYNGTTGSNNSNDNYIINMRTLEQSTKSNSGASMNLDLTFDNATINGNISASYVNHVDPVTGDVTDTVKAPLDFDLPYDYKTNPYTPTESYKGVARIENTPTPAKNNGVILALTYGTTWNISETCYLTKLTIDSSSTIVAPEGQTVTMTVDGEETTISEGEFTGAITLLVE